MSALFNCVKRSSLVVDADAVETFKCHFENVERTAESALCTVFRYMM